MRYKPWNSISAQVFTTGNKKWLRAQQNLTNAQLAAQASPSADCHTKSAGRTERPRLRQSRIGGRTGLLYQVLCSSNILLPQIKRQVIRSINPPTDTDIASARAALALAQAQEVQDQDLVTALTTGVIPDTATGPSLAALKQAQTALQTAQTDFNDTQIISPINGTVTAVNNQIGDTVGSATVITVSDLSRLLLNHLYR